MTQKYNTTLNEPILGELCKKGSLYDRLVSLKYFIEKKPQDAKKYYEDLINLCSAKNRRSQYLAIRKTTECIVETSITPQFPDDGIRNIHRQFLSILKDALDDKIPKIRMQIIGFLVDLARCSDHLKKSSINLIVNRFGDLDNKVAAHAQNILHGLMRDKVDDTEIIVGEVCSFIMRPNLPFKASYYSICFLNQVVLSKSQPELANMLYTVYLNLFNNFDFSQDAKSKMIMSILTGITRALPYTQNHISRNIASIDKLLMVADSFDISAAVRALIILFHIKQEQPDLSERYEETLYNFIFRECASGENHSIMLLFNLLYKSLTSQDDKEKRKFLCKQLLHICLHCTPEFACSSILLLSKVFNQEENISFLLAHITDEDDEIDVNQVSSWYFKALDMNNKAVGGNSKDNKLSSISASNSIWDFSLLKNHYHIPIRNFLTDFLNLKITHLGDPLVDFTHTAFIDRMINRKNKNMSTQKRVTNYTFRQAKLKCMIGQPSVFPEDSLLKNHTESKISFDKKIRKRRRNCEELSSDDELQDNFSKKCKL